MTPRSLIRMNQSYQDDDNQETSINLEFSWFDFHPGDELEQKITSYIVKQHEEEFSSILFYKGHVIAIRWWSTDGYGISCIMNAISDDIYRIGLDTYNWSRYITIYHDADPSDWDELVTIFNEDHHDREIEEIPKEIHREWFDIAIYGGTLELTRDDWDFHFNVANIFGFFPWIIYFANHGQITEDNLILDITINADFNLSVDEIFTHIDGELDEEFWLLIYQFVLELDSIPSENRGDTWYRYLQAVHDFTTESINYKEKVSNIFHYRDLLPIFDTAFLSDYVQSLLHSIADQPSDSDVCHLLLDFSSLLLELDFTDLGKLTEATTLEHALNLDDFDTKLEVIQQLTVRSSKWGEQHLIGFIQSLTGLLSHDETGQRILSQAIDLVIDQLKQSWDGILCIVESKLLSNQEAEAVEIRFEATRRIPDKYSRGEDIFTSLIWALDYDIDAKRLYELSKDYLDYAFETLTDEVIIEQTDILTQTAIRLKRFALLRLYFQYLQTHLHHLDLENHETLLDKLENILTAHRDYPLVYIDYLILRLFSLKYREDLVNTDYPFELVGQIFNNINPSLSNSFTSLKYISSKIISYGAITGDWEIIEETQRRFLLLTPDEIRAKTHLKTVFFKSSIDRAKLPSSKLDKEDIGIRLFQAGMDLVDLREDYDIVRKILPQIKKLAIKSRSYPEFSQLILTDVRLHKIHDEDWTEQFLDDVDILARKGYVEDIKHIFATIFTMDLTDQEREDLLRAQLELTEVEPDILSADEIYEKRMQLVNLGGTDEESQALVIDNYQRGISELISKADTSNLTNLLLDAISYTQKHESPELIEFKTLLLDNFNNIIEEFKESQSSDTYLYLLSIWRKVVDKFIAHDLDIIIRFAFKLFDLDHTIYRNSSNNQYLRRAQLVMKELTLVVKKSDLPLDELTIEELIEKHEILISLLMTKHQDFGITSAILESAIFSDHIGKPHYFLSHLDQGIAMLKKNIHSDTSAHSTIYLILLLIVEVARQVEADFKPDLLTEITSRLKRVINFALSVNLTSEMKQDIVELQQTFNESPEAFIREFPFSIGQYMENLAQL